MTALKYLIGTYNSKKSTAISSIVYGHFIHEKRKRNAEI